jgi:hypothetical protein
LKVNDENSRIRIQDPLVRGIDPRIRIRIRIHPKMSKRAKKLIKSIRTEIKEKLLQRPLKDRLRKSRDRILKPHPDLIFNYKDHNPH